MIVPNFVGENFSILFSKCCLLTEQVCQWNYSHLCNSQGGGNKQGGGSKVPDLIRGGANKQRGGTST